MADKIEIIDVGKAISDLDRVEKKIIALSKSIDEFNGSLSKIKSIAELESRLKKLEETTKKVTKAEKEHERELKKKEVAEKKAAAASERARKARLREADAIYRNKQALERQRKAALKAASANLKVAAASKKASTGFLSMSRSLKTIISAFGVIGGIQLFADVIKNTFELTKNLNSMAFAMKAVIKEEYELLQTGDWLNDITNKYGAELVSTTNRYIKFRAAAIQANFTAKETQAIFGTMTKAAGVLGLKTDELRGIYLALEQMISKGKITTEELRRQLGERLPGAMDIMAQSMGVTTSELDSMMKKGEVITKDVLPAFAKQVEKSFGIESVDKVETLTAATIRLSNSWTELIINLEGSEEGISGLFISLVESADEVINRWGSLNTIMSSNIDTWTAFKAIAKTPFSADDLHALATQIKYEKEREYLLKEANRLFDDKKNKQAQLVDLATAEQELNKLNNEQLKLWIDSMKAVPKVITDAGDAGGKRAKVEAIQTNLMNKELFGTVQYLEEQIKLYDEIFKISPNDETREWAKKTADAFRDLKDELLGVSDELPEIQKAINFEKPMGDFEVSLRFAIKALEDFNEKYGDLFRDGVETSNMFFDNRIEKLDQDRQANADYYDNLIDLASGNEEEQVKLKIEREAKDKELREKQNKAAKAQAIVNRSLAVFEIGLSTAQAITKSIAQTPLPAGLPFVVANAALGAAQIAATIAQPLPKFKHGTDNAPSGLAIVGDGGVHEYIEDRQGNIVQTPKTDTLVSFRGGEKVHKDLDSLVESKGIDSDIYKATVLTSLQVENRLSNLRVEKVLDNHLKGLDKKLTKGIRDGFKNVNMHNHTNVDLNHKFYTQDTL